MIFFQTRTYIHLFNQCIQNWFAVASILEDTLSILRTVKPNLKNAFLRSDNAGCYHTAFLLLCLPSLGKRAGINIARYDFSDPQAGKDVCDRRIATFKSHMRRFINEGNDIHSAEDMKTAIESYGGVKGCYAAVMQISESNQTMTKHTMPGMQALNNFRFESTGLRAWRAYNVGPGKLFTKAQLKGYGKPQGPTRIVTLKPFSMPKELVGVFKTTTAHKTATPSAEESTPQDDALLQAGDAGAPSSVCFSCPEEGCIKIYQSYQVLQKHLDVGKHLIKLERESSYDSIKMKWADTCQDVSGSYVQKNVASSSQESVGTDYSSIPTTDEGWALKKTRKSTRFSEGVRSYLKNIFIQGEETGTKANPADIASKMKMLRSENGKKMFSKDEWLSTDQVSRYFSKLSSLNKSGRLELDVITQGTHDEDVEDYVAEAEEILTRKKIRRALEL